MTSKQQHQVNLLRVLLQMQPLSWTEVKDALALDDVQAGMTLELLRLQEGGKHLLYRSPLGQMRYSLLPL